MRLMHLTSPTGHSTPSRCEAEFSGFSHSDIRAQLNKISASVSFSGSDRPRRFLRFAVEQVLLGQTDRLKEYPLGVEIFGRKPSFDPHFDPIVRAEAARLRTRLAAYYRKEGRRDPIVIELPKKTYVPVIRKRVQVRPSVRDWLDSRARWWTLGAIAALIMALVAGALWLARSAPKPAAPPLSIVVLPFADLSPAKDQEYLGDGLTDELIEALSRVDRLHVVSRTSSFHFKGRTEDLRQIRAELKVDLALAGSIRSSGDRLRVIAELVNAGDDHRVWSGSYDRQITDVFRVQQEIARSIVEKLRVELAGALPTWSARRHVPTPEAHDLYLRGLYFARQWGEDGLRKGVRCFEQAIRADPDYGDAYAGLAECHSWLGVHGSVAPDEAMPMAKTAAAKALEIDDTSGNPHASLGLVKALYEWDWNGAAQEFRRALDLEPGDTAVHEAYVMAYLLPRGSLAEALKEIERAQAYDPVSPRIISEAGLTHYYLRQYDNAIMHFQMTIELSPHFYPAYLGLGSAYEQKSKFPEAVEAVQEGRLAWSGGIGPAALAHVYARMGRSGDAETLLKELTQLSRKRYVSGTYLAAIALGLGDRQRALDWLERAVKQRASSLAYLNVDPTFDSLRNEPRFVALLKRIGLE